MQQSLAGWLAYLESTHTSAIALGLERAAQVWKRLDHDPACLIITVGGTNGKGSVCAMLEAILHAAGYKVGCYTSPHLLRYNERVRIGKQQVGDAALCAAFAKIEAARCRDWASAKDAAGLKPGLQVPLTYFEFGTLAAMQLFIEHKVDIAILEVGLGGRLDAVNIFASDCAVVASVDIDHTDYLGETRAQIAFEKAGIFRAGKVAICADDDVPQALIEHAEKIGAQLWCIGREFAFEICDTDTPITLSPSPRGETASHSTGLQKTAAKPLLIPQAGEGARQGGSDQWNYRSKLGARNALPYPALRGAFQLHNASAALAALDALKDKLPVSMEALRRGLLEVRLAGRFQVVPGKPQFILDVAHNPHAARALARNLAGMPRCPHAYAVFAMLRDKDMAGVALALDAHIDTWLVAGIDAPRGASAAQLAQVLQSAGVRGKIMAFDGVAGAVAYACGAADENDRIAVFGSFHTVAEAMIAKGLES